MLYLKIEESNYNKMKILLPDICPDVEFDLIATDDNLKKLGLCADSPCVIAFNIDESRFDQMMDELIQLEIDAFNVSDGYPSSDDPLYQRYIKYGWMWNVLHNAEEIENWE